MPNECPSSAMLAQYATGELSEAEAAVVDTHIGCCTTCLERMNGLETGEDSVLAALRQLPRTPSSNSESLSRAIAASLHRAKPAAAPGLTRGAELSGYRIVEELGRGGMGRVYRAAHPRLDQEVALKVLRPGLDSAPILARFEAERQALARMDHPNIARVLDGGATIEGQPFFAMELVRGVAVTRYCDENTLDVRRRLELFASICRAVQHAHQKGIIHRDLKPSNVLIAEYDGRPTVKVIDFGVAKATDRPAEVETEVGVLVGTPESMSPEQANLTGQDIDTRTDVYGLGGILYELLTGDTPFERRRLRAAPILEVLRIVREEEPAAPSARLAGAASIAEIAARRGTEPGPLIHRVLGDLDWIVQKSIGKDRNRRYESASAFADDVERYLNDEPVLARPPSAMYRFQKFARRNKGKLAAAAVLGLASLVAVSAIGWAVRDRSARDEMALRTQADRKARVEAQIQLILDEVARLEREQKWPEALDTARRASDLLAGSEVEADVAGQMQDTIRALELVRLLEDIRADKSEWKERSFDYRGTAERYAAAFRDVGIDLARLTPEEAAQSVQSRTAVLAALIPVLDDWAACRHITGDKRGAQSVLYVQEVVDPDPWRQKVRQALRTRDEKALLTLAAAPDLSRQPAATLAHLGATLGIMGRVDAALGVLSLARRQYPGDFWVHFNMGEALVSQGLPSSERAAGCYRTALGLRPRNTAAWNNLGNVLWTQGQQEEAIDCFNKAIAFDPKFANAHVSLGRCLFEQKKLDDAIVCFNKAVELNAKLPSAHYNLGVVLNAQKKLDEAIASYKKAIELHPKNAKAHINLANILWRQRKLDDAIAHYRRAIEIDPQNATAHSNLGNALYWHGKVDDAIVCFNKSIELDPKVASAHFNLGVALVKLTQFDNAIVSLQKAIELDPKNAQAHNYLGGAFLGQNKLDDAVVWYRKALELSPTDAGIHCNLGFALSKQGKFDDAIASHKRAIELDPKLVEAHSKLGAILCDQKKDDDGAIAAFRKAIVLQPRTALYHFNLGVALLVKGDLNEAIAGFREVIWLQPNHPIAHACLVRCLTNCADLKLRNPQEALQVARKAVELAPKSDSAWLAMGLANYRIEDWKASIAALEKSIALQTNPNGGDAYQWLFLAMAHRQIGDTDEARRWYDRAIEWMDKNSPLKDELRRSRIEAEEVLQITRD